MDIKPTKYKKGDMVRYHIGPEEPALGIILEQDGGKAKVHWVKPPRRGYSKKSAFRLFTDFAGLSKVFRARFFLHRTQPPNGNQEKDP